MLMFQNQTHIALHVSTKQHVKRKEKREFDDMIESLHSQARINVVFEGNKRFLETV